MCMMVVRFEMRISLLSATLLALTPSLLPADTLVLRNGRRIEGQLVRVRDDRVEFEDRNGRRSEYDRDQLDRIEFGRGAGDDRPGYDRPGYQGPGDQRPGETIYERPERQRQRRLDVSANQPWTDTGIRVREGDRIWIEARGRVHWGGDRNDGPEGERGSPYNSTRPIPDRPGAALIGRVDRDVFFIGGDRRPLIMPRSGRLQLGINDDVLRDNSGAFQVTIYY
jgi:hypothetical protein